MVLGSLPSTCTETASITYSCLKMTWRNDWWFCVDLEVASQPFYSGRFSEACMYTSVQLGTATLMVAIKEFLFFIFMHQPLIANDDCKNHTSTCSHVQCNDVVVHGMNHYHFYCCPVPMQCMVLCMCARYQTLIHGKGYQYPFLCCISGC